MNRKLIKEIGKMKSQMGLLSEDVNEEFVGLRVMVYYNLHKKTFSVTYDGRVILYADYVKLKNVEFRVREGGKEKVRQEMRKNVHAFVIGDLIDYCEYPCENMPEETNDRVITYNPYKYDSFVKLDSEDPTKYEPIYNANEIDMINTRNKIFHINEVVI